MINEFVSVLNKIFENNILKIIISNKRESSKYKKIVIEVKNKTYFVSKYTLKQVFHENLNKEEVYEFLINQTKSFKQFEFFDINNIYLIKFSKKNKIFYTKSLNKNNLKINKEKNYILKENEIIEPLIDMGIFNKDGKVISKMYNKYKQINRFLEIIDDKIKKENIKTLNIIDFGCGKSYLTFIIYYYLTQIKNIETKIIGLDLKKEVIENCNKTAEKYGYNNIKFILGDIKDYNPPFIPDMVITLHACDTATDYALYNAIKWKSKMIFSVPCCQHEINESINGNNKIITRYGIAKERISAIFTDIIRCNLLKTMNYNVDLMEFVDFESTPKNLLIRASLSNIPTKVKKEMINEVEELINEYKFNQTLYRLLSREIDSIKSIT